MSAIEIILLIGFILFVIWAIRNISNNSTASGSLGGLPVTQVLSHWANALPFFSMSSNEFYATLEEALKYHEMPDVKIARANNKEGGMFSASREYLRIKHRDLVFDICAAPFGRDFFISWWLYETEGTMRQILKYTKAGEYLRNRAAKRTFYQADEETMFRTCVHNVVLESIEKVTQGKAIRLTEHQKAITIGGM